MERKSLKDWAQSQGVSYSKAYRQYKSGKIENTFKEKGDIYVNTPDILPFKNKNKEVQLARAMSVASEGRKNRAADSLQIDPYKNIKSLYSPTLNDARGTNPNLSTISARDMVTLCQKAYYGVASVRRVIDTLRDFCCSTVHLRGGNAKSRKFYTEFFKAVNLDGFQNKFYTEFWRSGTNAVYTLEGVVDKTYLDGLSTYSSASLTSVTLPAEYIILNPADIVFNSSAFFSTAMYSKKLNSYEVERLKDPQTPQEKQIFNALDPKIQAQLRVKGAANTSILVPLDKKNVTMIFNGKQDYECFAVSPIYPVLDDIEFKIQLKKMDQAIAKTCQSAVLHISLGYEDKNGEYHFDNEVAESIKEIFNNEQIGRVLITDFTAKVNFVLPAISDLLDPAKYTIVDQDIHEGLMDVIFGGGGSGEKFSNLSVKIKVFMEKIKKSRRIFLNEFLIPQMQKIGEQMRFKSIPEPELEEIDIEDNINFYRVISQLATVGILTPEETFEAFESGRLPNQVESEESQRKFKELKDAGLYQPITANVPMDPAAPGGRPGGTSAPQTTKKVSPIGTKASFNYESLAATLKQEVDFKGKLETILKKKYSIKKFNEVQMSFFKDLASEIILNEPSNSWASKIEDYLTNNYSSTEQKLKIHELSAHYNISLASAAAIYHAGESK